MDNFKTDKNSFLPKTVSRDQAKDTGMAMVLICLLVWYFGNFEKLFALSLILLIINMIVPNIYKPVAKLWLGLSNFLGTIMSKILLTFLFFILVTPTGIFRRIIGKDTLQLKKWKDGSASVFQVRDYLYKPKDIDKPY